VASKTGAKCAALGLAAALGCDAGPAALDGDDANAGSGKADAVFGIEEGSPEAIAIQTLASEASLTTLDDDVGLDRRAAEGIIVHRPASGPDDEDGYQSLAELDRIPFMAKSAFEKLLRFVVDERLVGRRLKISTFNIRWFGLNGDVAGSLGTETRVDTVRDFIRTHLGDRDVLVFQEIVDLDLFTEEVMPDHTCITYDGFSGKHQHVMLCHTDAYELRLADDEDDFELEALKIGQVRPGLHGTLVATADGEPVAHVIAVHLKANEHSTERRLEQARVLDARVEALRATSELPVIAIGDFNTHLAVHTGLPENDEDLLGDVLAPLQRVALPVTFTYQEKDGTQFRLDHAFVSAEIDVQAVTAAGPCDTDLDSNADAIFEYYDTVSDHCPLAFDLHLRAARTIVE
jgi:endonuclease/exonuclease/phosphatase family metal-dependent hydrolase